MLRGHFIFMKLRDNARLKLPIITHVFQEFHECCDLLLFYGEIEVLSELTLHQVLHTLKLTTQDGIGPNLRFAISHIFVK